MPPEQVRDRATVVATDDEVERASMDVSVRLRGGVSGLRLRQQEWLSRRAAAQMVVMSELGGNADTLDDGQS